MKKILAIACCYLFFQLMGSLATISAEDAMASAVARMASDLQFLGIG